MIRYAAIKASVRQRFPGAVGPYLLFKRSLFSLMHPTRKSRFEAIARGNHWRNGESLSGFGSTLDATEVIRAELEHFIATCSIESVLDIPCGDFNWMRRVQFNGSYTGADIVEFMVDELNIEFENDPKRDFVVLDLIEDPLPAADLIFSRECLNHLSLRSALAAAKNLAQSQARFIALTDFPACESNSNQETGFIFRPLNFRLPPFNFPPPDYRLAESPGGGKVMSVWHVERIKGVFK